jgi:thiol-disulfide isomerase/thioredoxin
MKYLVPPLILLAALGATAFGTWALFPQAFDDCCEWLGLIAPDGVSEVPGQSHVTFERTSDGKLPTATPGLRIGDQPGELSLLDLHGEPVTIATTGAPATVVLWTSSFCPTSRIYEERLAELSKRFPEVRWVAVNSSAMEGLAELRAHFEDNPELIGMPVYKDNRNVLADQFGARVTTESYVFDSDGRLLYRGAIDDARNPQRVRTQYLADAVTAVTIGRTPKWEYQPANGCCPIDRLEPEPEPETP